MTFSLPHIIDPGLAGDGTLGFTLLDLVDHWAFSYSLLLVGLLECLLIGWVLGADRLREVVNRHSKFHLGPWFNVLIKLVIPAILAVVLTGTLITDLAPLFDGEAGGLYGSAYGLNGVEWLPAVVPLVWLIGTIVMAAFLTSRPTHAPHLHNEPEESLA